MAVDDFPRNLNLLSSYARSVSEICRQTGINRQQYDRYLKGRTRPSLRTVRRICDFFGVDDHEIFLDHESFREIVQVKPPKQAEIPDALHGFFDRLCRPKDQTLADREKYVGYYFYYCQPFRGSSLIYRTLARFYEEVDLLLTKGVERYLNDDFNLPRVLKHEGVIYGMADRLVWVEREMMAGASLWQGLFYPSDFNSVRYLSGLSLGITSDGAHDIVCYRSVLEYLGKRIDVKAALRQCRAYDPGSPEISQHVRNCVSNEQAGSADVFMPRY
jgi:transcriptional regulator with XRE-family HTH domain